MACHPQLARRRRRAKDGAGGRNRTDTGSEPHGILSPARLPVSPLRPGGENSQYNSRRRGTPVFPDSIHPAARSPKQNQPNFVVCGVSSAALLAVSVIQLAVFLGPLVAARAGVIAGQLAALAAVGIWFVAGLPLSFAVVDAAKRPGSGFGGWPLAAGGWQSANSQHRIISSHPHRPAANRQPLNASSQQPSHPT
jgi:hypothetical protein